MENYEPILSFGEETAEIYDDSVRGDEMAIVECLERLAGGGPALELAIGTGRIALPLAARGIRSPPTAPPTNLPTGAEPSFGPRALANLQNPPATRPPPYARTYGVTPLSSPSANLFTFWSVRSMPGGTAIAGLVKRKPRRCTSPIGPLARAARTLCTNRVPPLSGLSSRAQRWKGTCSPTGFEIHSPVSLDLHFSYHT